MQRLYNTVCQWLETDAQAKQTEPIPQGDTFTQSEHAHSFTSYPEMRSGYREQSIDDDNGAHGRPISLRWRG